MGRSLSSRLSLRPPPRPHTTQHQPPHHSPHHVPTGPTLQLLKASVGHAAHEALTRAADAVEKVADAVNEQVRAQEGRTELLLLADSLGKTAKRTLLNKPGRYLVSEVECLHTVAEVDWDHKSASLERDAQREHRLWLCSDLLLLGVKRSDVHNLVSEKK